VISEFVVEKVKDDHSIRSASEHHEKIKEDIKELREMPVPKPQEGMHAELDSLRNMVKESLNISYALAKELSSDREPRGTDFTAATQRLKVMEQEISNSSRPRSATRAPQAVVGKNVREPSIDSNSSLDRVMGGLQRIVGVQSTDEARVRSNSKSSMSPRTTPNQSRSASANGDDSNDFGSEVKALRSRLENIFHIQDGSESELTGTQSTVLSGTVGSLPTVQES
jgi:hypothetical protein